MPDPLAPFDGLIPPDRIAQQPADPRDSAKLLVLDRATSAVAHHTVRDLPTLLHRHDCLVLNETRVLPARLSASRASGGRVQLLLIPPATTDARWECYADAGGRLQPGERLSLPGGEAVVLADSRGGGRWRLDAPGVDLPAACTAHGRAPLPPYIKRAPDTPTGPDRDRYQTVYAREPGAIAAPTAGLHFTPALLAACEAAGVRTTRLVLHVGPGTFAPPRAPGVGGPEPEACRVPVAVADAVAVTRAAGGRVIAVGTTVVRALEWAAVPSGRVQPREGAADIVIQPGHKFLAVDALLTNFHQSDSSPLRLTAAFAGIPPLLSAYRAALGAGYRFFSYGDAMLIR